MSESQKSSESRIGLDVGTSRIVLARKVGEEFVFTTQLNGFVTIPFSRITEGVFKKEGIPHTVADGQITVYGDEAEKFANIFHIETRRPMYRGALNPNEPGGPAVVRQIISILLGPHAKSGQRLCASLPAPPLNADDDLKYHATAIEQTTAEFGFKVTTINEALAVVYSELADSNYTGIGVSCGGGMCNVCLAVLSVPVIMFSVPQAGDFIDSSAAAASGEVATRIRLIKERTFHLNGSTGDKIQHALTVYYDEMIRELVDSMNKAFSDVRALPKLDRPVPLVLSGGTSLVRGFRERFEKALRASPFPLPVSDVLLAQDPLNSTATGALISAMSE